MEKTFNMVQRAFNFGDGENIIDNFKPLKQPMVDSEFHNYLDVEGRLVKPRELRLSVYQGGIEPALRKVVWKHILNVYPTGLTAKDRISYMKQRTSEYVKLRQAWQDMISNGNVNEEIHYVTNMVRKDVLRTDRTHRFYAGSDDNKNVVSLFNILITYALNHASVSYCQGMSDLASPILVTMKDESHAYVCFCALMQRLKPNFQLDGKAMSSHFQQLTELLQFHDLAFFTYLKNQGADDLLFCYRWLLLELKREFAFDDALRMLEVLWSSIPPSPPEKDLSLYEELFTCRTAHPCSPRIHSRENPYTKVRAIRKQNSASSIRALITVSTKENDSQECKPQIKDEEKVESFCITDEPKNNVEQQSLGGESTSLSRQDSFTESSTDDSQDYLPMTTSMTRELRMELENLNRQLPGSFLQRSITVDSEDLDSPQSPDCCVSISEDIQVCPNQLVIDQSIDDDAPESWNSDDLSCIDQISKISSFKKYRKNIPDCFNLDDKISQPIENICYSPDDQCVNVKQSKSLNDAPCNGEIFENEESEDVDGCSCHLKSVIPIRLVHSPGMDSRHHRNSSDSSDSTSDSSSSTSKNSDPNSLAILNNISQLKPESIASSKETLVQDKQYFDQTNQYSTLMSEKFKKESAVTNSCEEALEYSGKITKPVLPPPYELGGGNPFMLFLCLTLLLQHRDIIMKNHMDYNELAMHFDKMVRKHNVHRVLHQARALFREYLQMGWQENNWGTDPQV